MDSVPHGVYTTPMHPFIETELETESGRWIAEIPTIPGCLAYGTDRDDAIRQVVTLALRVIAERVELGEMDPATALATLHAA